MPKATKSKKTKPVKADKRRRASSSDTPTARKPAKRERGAPVLTLRRATDRGSCFVDNVPMNHDPIEYLKEIIAGGAAANRDGDMFYVCDRNGIVVKTFVNIRLMRIV